MLAEILSGEDNNVRFVGKREDAENARNLLEPKSWHRRSLHSFLAHVTVACRVPQLLLKMLWLAD